MTGEKTGKITTKTRMTLDHFNDFYYLQALQAQIGMKISGNPELQFSRAVEKLREDVDEAASEIVPNIALRTFVYLYAACMGEARHANTGATKERNIPATRRRARSEVYAMSADYPADRENINALIDIFSQEWHSGYGGKAWRKIAEALHWYYDLSNETFIDHVIDLEHNGGTVFNKDDAKYAIYFQVSYQSGRLSKFLDYKFEKNILEDVYVYDYDYSLHVTRKVAQLIQRYSTIFRTKRATWIRGDLPKLDGYNIEWGNKRLTIETKWSEWADVSKGNKPSARHLLSMAGLNDLYAANFTLPQLKKRLAEIKDIAVLKAGAFMTDELAKTLDKTIKNWVKLVQNSVKTPKAKVTFQVLPAKVKWTAKGIKVALPVKYSKLGKKTEYGLMFETTNHFGIPQKAFTETSQNFIDDGALYADGHIAYSYGNLSIELSSGYWNFPYKPVEALLD